MDDKQFLQRNMRDRFAMAALTGYVASFTAGTTTPDPDRLADFAYRVADEMLKRREARPESDK